jgi:hypothetical protein
VYRQKADHDVYSALSQKAELLGIDPTHFAPSIDPDPASRFFDPSNPDRPPMPPDDPLSHELMRKVDGKNGADTWQKEGVPEPTRPREWEKLLSKDAAGPLRLDLRGAVRLSLLNSRDFQREKEDLYLSALDVTFERFQFSPRLATGQTGRAEWDGKYRAGLPPRGVDRSEQKHYTVLTDGSVRWLSATGGELLAGFANSFVWDFNGQQARSSAGSLINFSLVQPLLRLGGRVRTLERLTQSERSLLANVRQMEQFQQGFYLRIACGRSSGEGPSRGNLIGASGLGIIAGTPSGRTGTPRADGYLGILEETERLRNLESNVARLRESHDQLAAAFDAGRISSRLQVDQARQALFNAQSSLLSAKAAYLTRLDAYKVELGLPPDVVLVVQDSLLDRLKTSDPAAVELDSRVAGILGKIRDREISRTKEDLAEPLTGLLAFTRELGGFLKLAQRDLEAFKRVLPERRAQMERLRQRPEARQLSLDTNLLLPSELEPKLGNLTERLLQQNRDLDELTGQLKAVEGEFASLEFEPARKRLIDLASRSSALLLSLSLTQTATRLESAMLSPVELSEEKALSIAREHRLDWMNARARLVDAWRKIDFHANALQSGLSVTLNGNVGTLGANHPTSFDARTAMLQAGLRFDSPLNRLAERNDYRESQIDYQRARRDYMLFEDRIQQSIRNTLRLTQLSELNFELRRSAVQVAVAQVDLARLRLDEPPRPGATPQFGATTARDLVSALNDLLDAQNDFLSMRVGYDVLRMVLDFELGTMHTGQDGLWTDPGPINESRLTARMARWKELAQVDAPSASPQPLSHRTHSPQSSLTVR